MRGEAKPVGTVVRYLKSSFPDIHGFRAGWDTPDSVLLGDAAEGGTIYGIPAADYYGEGRGGYPWIHPMLKLALKRSGYFIEWYDAGTLVAYPA